MKFKKLIIFNILLSALFSLSGMEQEIKEVQKYNLGIQSFLQLLPNELTGKLLQDYGCPGLIYWLFKHQAGNKKVARNIAAPQLVRISFYDPIYKRLFIAYQNNILQILDLEKNIVIKTIQLKGNVHCFCQDGKQFFIGCAHTIKIFDLTSFELKQEINIPTTPTSLLVNKNTNELYIGSIHNYILIYDLSTRAYKRSLVGHAHAVDYLILNQAKNLLFSCAYDSTVKIWDLQTDICVKTIAQHDSLISCFAINEEKKYILIGNENGQITVYDSESGADKGYLPDCEDAVHSIKIISLYANKIIVIADKSGKIYLYNDDLELINYPIEIPRLKDFYIDEENFKIIAVTENKIEILDLLNIELCKKLFDAMTAKKYLSLKAAYEWVISTPALISFEQKKDCILNGFADLPAELQATIKPWLPALPALGAKRESSQNQEKETEGPLYKKAKK